VVTITVIANFSAIILEQLDTLKFMANNTSIGLQQWVKLTSMANITVNSLGEKAQLQVWLTTLPIAHSSG
jgi:hypothetical protein